VGSLINPKLKPAFIENVRNDYEKLRAQHGQQKARPLLSIQEARQRRMPIEWNATEIAQPEFAGIRTLATDGHETATPITLGDLVPFIDWSPFFHTWEIRGRYPAILEKPEAKRLFDDAQSLLDQIVSQKLLSARAVYGFFPANSVEDDVELYADEGRSRILSTFHFLRQQIEKQSGEWNHCLADFVAPRSTLPDYLGAFAVSAGFGVEALCKRFEQDHDDYNSIMTKALADRLAEAFAEFLHKRAREEWGYGRKEALTNDDLIREKYRGIRPAAGYPACPDHTEKWILWELLDVEKRVGIKLTESCAMWPGASVSGLYFSHPASKYFAVGKLGRDQMIDYHLRKKMDLRDVERWLGPYLDYEPGSDEAPATTPAAKRPGACGCGVPHVVGSQRL
jgi:5-methyltetrahydrofolate--homocysteine methyltransferase